MVAVQDGVIHTRSYRERILKEPISPVCRVCKLKPETIGHLLSACETMCWKARHDRVLGLARRFGFQMPEKLRWGPDGWNGVAVIENSQVKLVIDVSIPTDSNLVERRPDLILYVRSEKRALIFDVTCAWEPLIPERERGKRSKYRALANDIASQKPGWSTMVHPLVVGDLGSLVNFRVGRRCNPFEKGGIIHSEKLPVRSAVLRGPDYTTNAIGSGSYRRCK